VERSGVFLIPWAKGRGLDGLPWKPSNKKKRRVRSIEGLFGAQEKGRRKRESRGIKKGVLVCGRSSLKGLQTGEPKGKKKKMFATEAIRGKGGLWGATVGPSAAIICGSLESLHKKFCGRGPAALNWTRRNRDREP